MIFNFFRNIFWNFHVLLQSYSADTEVVKTLGSASLFGSGTLFWSLSIYELCASFIIKSDPLMNSLPMFFVFLFSLAFSILIIVTTKNNVDEGYVRIGFLNKSFSKLISLFYVVGSFILFFGFII